MMIEGLISLGPRQDQKDLNQKGFHVILKGTITNSTNLPIPQLLSLYTVINWAFL